MPKIRTNRTAAKRFSVTATGKVKFKHAYARHMFTCKSPKQKSRLRKTGILGKADAARVFAMMPYAR
jgi:large subunit ribosomal protein L35